MMDPHNPQMQYYNQQNDWTGVKLSPHEDIPQHQYTPYSRDSKRCNYAATGESSESAYNAYCKKNLGIMAPTSGYHDSETMRNCSSYYGRMQPAAQDPAKDFYAHHMMQMAQVAQAPRRGRKPLNEKKKRRKRNRPGSHIKRAKTAYFFFLDVFRKSYAKDGDQIPKVIKASEITKACGKQWGIMTEADKKHYADQAAEDRKRYESEMLVYRKVRDPDKPKKPATAFFYFLTDFRKQMAGQKIEKGRRLTVICGEEWNKLTDQQKKPYLDKVAVEYKKYQERMEEYRRTKGMASPPQPKSAPQPQPQPQPQAMIPQAMTSQVPLVPLGYNSKPLGAGLPMQVPQDDEEESEEEEEEEDDM